jgi:Tfp pilus assembly protein PilZ
MRDHRRTARRNSPHRVNVLAAASDKVLGRLVNITVGGLMFLAPGHFPVGTVLELRLPLPTMANSKMSIDVAGTVVWCRPDSNARFQRVGIQFEKLGAEEGYIIETVLQRMHLVG